MKFVVFILFALTAIGGCPRIGAGPAEKVVIPAGERAFYPRFDASGEQLLLTAENYRGLKLLNLATGRLVTVSEEEGAGYHPLITGDGQTVVFVEHAYRDHLRYSRLVSYSLGDGQVRELQPLSRRVPLPVPAGSDVLVADGERLKSAGTLRSDAHPEEAVAVVIEEQQLVLYRNGERKIISPYPEESYIWPSLSPDGKRIVAYAMGKGVFVCDLQGRIEYEGGSLEAPVWAGNRLLAGMVTADDGHQIIRSEVRILDTENREQERISPEGIIALYPTVSLSTGRIAWHTPEGEIYIQKYILKK
jgi:Tol biopolymer transport system component